MMYKMKNEKLMEKNKKNKNKTKKASYKKTVKKRTSRLKQQRGKYVREAGTYKKATNDLWSPSATFKEQGLKRETHITISAK